MTAAVELQELARDCIRDDDGATLVEFGLILALIAIVCLAALTAIGAGLNGIWHTIDLQLHPTP